MTESDDDAALRLEIGLRKLAEKFSTETFEDNKRLVAELSRLTSGLRELLDSDGHETDCQFHGCTCGRTELYKVARAKANRLLRTLLPEATKEVPDGKI